MGVIAGERIQGKCRGERGKKIFCMPNGGGRSVRLHDGGLGMSMKQFNEDVGDKTMADITSSAMIDEGDDCDDFDREKNESEFI